MKQVTLAPWWCALVLALSVLFGPAARAVGGEGVPTPNTSVTLRSGDVLRGQLVQRSPDSISILHPELGTVTVAMDKVVDIATLPLKGAAPAVETVAPEAGATASPATAATAGPAPTPATPWEYFLSLALGGSFNTNDEFSIRAGAGARYETDAFRFRIDGEYYFRILNDANVDNNLLVTSVQEWTIGTTPWFAFAEEQYQYDEFQSWEHRVSLYAGAGYRVFDREDLALTLRGGFGATYDVGPDDWTPQALVGEEFRWKISSRQSIAVDASLAPSLTDLNDYLLQSSAEYALAVSESKKGASLTFGVRNIYDNKPPSGSTHNDLRFYGGLRYDF